MRARALAQRIIAVLMLVAAWAQAAEVPAIRQEERAFVYVREIWGIYADANLLLEALNEPSPHSPEISLGTKISWFLLALDIADQAKAGNYIAAIESGAAWSVKTAAAYYGFPWLGAAMSFAHRVYKFGAYLVRELDRAGINSQFEYYFWYRDDDAECTHERLVFDGCGIGLRDGWLYRPNGWQSGTPHFRGLLTPAQFFELAKYLYDTARLDSARKNEEATLKQQLQDALDALQHKNAAPIALVRVSPVDGIDAVICGDLNCREKVSILKNREPLRAREIRAGPTIENERGTIHLLTITAIDGTNAQIPCVRCIENPLGETAEFWKLSTDREHEYECDLASVTEDRAKWEQFAEKYPKSIYSATALKNLVFLNLYPIQCGVAGAEGEALRGQAQAAYIRLLEHFPGSNPTSEAGAWLNTIGR